MKEKASYFTSCFKPLVRQLLCFCSFSIYGLPAHSADGPPSTSSSCCKLAPSGTLTLGAAHKLVDGNLEVLAFTGLPGQISLFRLWGREWSKEEVTSLKCIEGDLVTWRSDDWDTQACAPVHDSSLRCGEVAQSLLHNSEENVSFQKRHLLVWWDGRCVFGWWVRLQCERWWGRFFIAWYLHAVWTFK